MNAIQEPVMTSKRHFTPSIQTESVLSFIQDYFEVWKGTDEDAIMAYYSEDVVLRLPTAQLDGKTAVRDGFVRPFITAFPGNVHAIQNIAYGENLVAVEWNFEAVHAGTFAKFPATLRRIEVAGCSIYEYDLASRVITAGRIYFDSGTFLRQIGWNT